jgi:tetratricopeptide (TPR) repeat protein
MTACKRCKKEYPDQYVFCPLCGRAFRNEKSHYYWAKRAKESRNRGKMRDAIKAWKRYHELDDKNHYTHSNPGNLYYYTGDVDASIGYCQLLFGSELYFRERL